MSHVKGRLLMAATLTVLLTACGGKAPKPTSEIALTDAALQSAELAGAGEHAPIEFRQAQEKKQAADAAMAREDYELALRLNEEARVDAELARAKAEAVKSKKALSESQGNIDMMREEVARQSDDM